MPADRSAHPLRVLIADDESFNRLRIHDLLIKEPGITIVGEAEDGVQALSMIRSLRPDIVFLDVQMPGKTGIDVVRELGKDMPATIFVTAYDRYAVDAFEMAAVDYLVKPFDDERFEQAFQRARHTLDLEEMSHLRERLLQVLGADASAPPAATPASPPPHYIERIPVDVHGAIRPIPVSDIQYITASGPYAELVVNGRKYLIREAMQALEERLDPSKFMRIHRSVIVRLDQVEGLKRGAGGDGEVLLKGGGKLRVSRTRREALERWLGTAPAD